eukprot:28221-Chlamydomonas_euryale.AAC.2
MVPWQSRRGELSGVAAKLQQLSELGGALESLTARHEVLEKQAREALERLKVCVRGWGGGDDDVLGGCGCVHATRRQEVLQEPACRSHHALNDPQTAAP